MTAFEDLKSQWENQPEIEAPNNGAKLLIEKTDLLKKKQRITNIVLGITVVTLIGFFFYVAAYNNITVAFALLLMVGSLLTRILIEHFSIRKLKQMNLAADASAFKQIMVNYYKTRIKTHYITTPIMFLLYITGFIILLPFFKEGLSNWFYNYILVSGLVFFVIIGVFVRKQILKEIKVLKKFQD